MQSVQDLSSPKLLAASVALRDYLESTESICCAKFDIPDHLWVPFNNAIKATAQEETSMVGRSPSDQQQQNTGTGGSER
jgi:hypothetical protein